MRLAVNHPILKFEVNEPEWNKFDKLKDTELLQHRVIDWSWLEEIGSLQEMQDLVGPKLTDAMECTEP
ncbi:hypothetical protein HanPI659440_Chr09g0321601 [Helianthus annuus]|nr:hypothetical protein HanPI659440_Chr09g0321601 [Helianthus annuus]